MSEHPKNGPLRHRQIKWHMACRMQGQVTPSLRAHEHVMRPHVRSIAINAMGEVLGLQVVVSVSENCLELILDAAE